jgi:hypothetical protein
LGFWIPRSALGFYSLVPNDLPSKWIYYCEALGIVSALHYMVDHVPRGSWIVIYTDNMNAQSMFNTLAVMPLYNSLAKFAVDLLIAIDCNLRVLYVPSEGNRVADALSWRDILRALILQPDLKVHPLMQCWGRRDYESTGTVTSFLSRETGSLGAVCSPQCPWCINKPGLWFPHQELPRLC